MPDAAIQPLEVFVLDEDFKRLTGSIPYDSLIWRRRYYGVGEFQMQVRSSLYSTDWAYVYCDDRPETGVIQKVEYDDTTEGPRNGEDTVIVSGFFLEELLNRLVFLVEEYETEEIKHIVPKPTKAKQYPKPDFYQDSDGNYYAIWKNGTINNLMNGEAARVEDSQDLIDSLSPADVKPGKGIHQKVFHYDDGTTFVSGMYSSAYDYVSDDGKVTIIDGRDNTRGEYDVVGDPSAGLVLYEDADGSVKWVNGAVESHGDTYRRKTQRWESLQVDEDGNHYWMEYRDVEGPWMLRADIDDVKSPQDNVQWILKMAEKVFQGNFIYDTPGFTGETKTLSPSLSRIGDFFYQELQSVEASLRVLYHFESDQMVFQLWRGLDRTQDQGDDTVIVYDPVLPEGYTQLDWVQSSGSNYVDTGFTASSLTGFDIDFEMAGFRGNGNNHLLTTNGDKFFALRVRGDNTGFQARWGTQGLKDVPHSGSLSGRHSIHMERGVYTCDGGDPVSFTPESFARDQTTPIFAYRNTDGTTSGYTRFRLYSLKMRENGATERDFYPARRDEDGVVGLYDMHGGQFYTPNTGTLSAGPESEIPWHEEVVQGNPWAVFSDTWGTLYGYTASHDTSNYRNLAYVLYDYEEPVWDSSGHVALKKVAEYDDEDTGALPTITGYHYEVSSTTRRGYLTVRMEDDRPDAEVWIDRRSDYPDFMDGFEAGEVEEGTTYDFTKADFEAWVDSLRTDAESTLRNDYSDVDNLDTKTISTMRYLYDFDLGDKVDMAVEAIGMEKTARITEVEEVYESGSAEIHLTMGEELLTTDKKSLLV